MSTATVCARPKKPVVSGFSLLRYSILDEARSLGQADVSQDEINSIAGQKWDVLSDELKEEWRNEARECKMRSEKGHSVKSIIQSAKVKDLFSRTNDYALEHKSATVQMIHHSKPSRTDGKAKKGPPPPSMKLRKSKYTGFSIFQWHESTELMICADKRRQKNRRALLNSFTWHFSNDKEALRQSKFIFLSAQPLLFKDDIIVEPAEICCLEFSLKDGVIDMFCNPIKPNDRDYNSRLDEIKGFADGSHKFSLELLREQGSLYQEVAEKLISFSERRDPICQNIRFFILNAELEHTFDSLVHVLENSSTGYSSNKMTICDVAPIEDLMFTLFTFFGVDMSSTFQCDSSNDDSTRNNENRDSPLFFVERCHDGSRVIDLAELVDDFGMAFNSAFACTTHANIPKHAAPTDSATASTSAASCCLPQLRFVADFLQSCISVGRMDKSALKTSLERFMTSETPEKLDDGADIISLFRSRRRPLQRAKIQSESDSQAMSPSAASLDGSLSARFAYGGSLGGDYRFFNNAKPAAPSPDFNKSHFAHFNGFGSSFCTEAESTKNDFSVIESPNFTADVGGDDGFNGGAAVEEFDGSSSVFEDGRLTESLPPKIAAVARPNSLANHRADASPKYIQGPTFDLKPSKTDWPLQSIGQYGGSAFNAASPSLDFATANNMIKTEKVPPPTTPAMVTWSVARQPPLDSFYSRNDPTASSSSRVGPAAAAVAVESDRSRDALVSRGDVIAANSAATRFARVSAPPTPSSPPYSSMASPWIIPDNSRPNTTSFYEMPLNNNYRHDDLVDSDSLTTTSSFLSIDDYLFDGDHADRSRFAADAVADPSAAASMSSLAQPFAAATTCTLRVQRVLPANQRGLGRGLNRLSAEAALLSTMRHWLRTYRP